jgi:hypothetical protein
MVSRWIIEITLIASWDIDNFFHMNLILIYRYAIAKSFMYDYNETTIFPRNKY